MPGGFSEVADGAWVRTGVRETATTTIVEVGVHGCILVDPTIEPADLEAIAAFLSTRALHVEFGWSTHPHWDHVLWSSGFGRDVPRYATATNARTCAGALDALREEIRRTAPGHELDLCAVLTPVEEAGSAWPSTCEVVEHQAHAPGHGALFFEDIGLFVAGDMLSDIEIPSFDLERADPLADYAQALDRYARYVTRTSVLVPGHGAPGDRREMQRRLDLDRAYLDDLASGRDSPDARREPPWLKDQHELQVAWCRTHPSAARP